MNPPANLRLIVAALALSLAIPSSAQTAPLPDQPPPTAAPAPAPPPPTWKIGPVDVSGMADGYYELGSITRTTRRVSGAPSTTRPTSSS